ncbi:MAG: GAF domain-containing sensor histidine kinase [Acidimicrobiia bacterium]|nr:GAF domain-containing sensor histidine kinase [Acidimicrobiia bacterium]
MTSEARSWNALPDQTGSGKSPRAGPTMRPDDLSMLLRITDAFSSGWKVSEILDSLYDELQAILPFSRMEYSTIDDTGYVLTTEWFRATYPSRLIPLGFQYKRSVHVASDPRYKVTALSNDMPAYAENRPEDHPVSLLVSEGMKSSLSCPLVVDDEVQGFLFFNTARYNGYSEHHATMIQLIAGHIASVLARARLHDELAARNKRLQELEQSRLEFIASISHELRTPLTAVVGFASEMQDKVGQFSPDELSQFAGVIAAQSTEVAGIVEDILVITRAEAGHLTVAPALVDVSTELSDLSVSLPEERPEQQVTVELRPVKAWADPLRLRQIVRNLLSNAARYGGDDVSVTAGPVDGVVAVVVTDDGPGIPEQDRDMVFQAYGRSHLSEGKPGSIGLGLTVSRYLAEAMGGQLEYERVGTTSRFTLTLLSSEPEGEDAVT